MRRTLAHALETGRWSGPLARGAARVWGAVAARQLVRPEVVPEGVALVCVGGATLGGSGKTRVAIAAARLLAEEIERVVLVGHAYRARPLRPRIVRGDESVDVVGDEALVCARALGAVADVVVAPSRQAAIDHAIATGARALVLDGALRIAVAPRATLALLAVDAMAPWGAGRPPPAGDLRAPQGRLLACADATVPVDATPSAVRWEDGHRAPLASLAGQRLGLFTAIARPERLAAALGAAGIVVAEVVSVADHGAPPPALPAGVDAWIATEKCALHLGRAVRTGILEGSVTLPAAVADRLRALARP